MPADRGRTLRALLGRELRDLARDRRTLWLSVVAPLVVLPLVLLANSWLQREREARLDSAELRYTVVGPAADAARPLLRRALALPGDLPALAGRELPADDPPRDLQARALDLVVEADRGPDGGLLLHLVHRADRDLPRELSQRLRERLLVAHRQARGELLQDLGATLDVDALGRVEVHDLASAHHSAGAWVGRFVVLLVLFLVLSGGAVIAADSVAGEKERGTLETLLTSAASRQQILLAKGLAIGVVGSAVATIQVLDLAVCLRLELFQLPHAAAVALSPLDALLLLVLLAPLVALAAAALLVLSARARSVREAQLLFVPLILLGALPALAALLPGLGLRSPVLLVPVASTAVAVRELLAGRPDALAMLVVVAVNTLTAALGVRLARRALDDEARLLPAIDDAPGARARTAFERQLPWLFGVLFAAILAFAVNSRGGAALVGQVFFNLIVVFGGGTLWTLWRYRLDVDETLSLRRPPAATWLAVAVGVPGFYIGVLGAAELLARLLPVPEAWVESMTRALLPDEVPLHLLLLFIAVLPGVFEELAFRGLLLHGLRRRLSPLATVVVVGLVFGVFHVSLYRILPTALLGVVLTAVVLRSGSIYPAMVWHAANNTLGVLAARAGLDVEALPAPLLAVGLLGCGLSAWILWRAGGPRAVAGTAGRPRPGTPLVSPPP